MWSSGLLYSLDWIENEIEISQKPRKFTRKKEKRKKRMQGQISNESEVRLPAGLVWETYGTLELANLVIKLIPSVVQKAEIVQGDGGVGTVLSLTFPSGFSVYKEKFTKIDNEKRVKEVELVEGGYLDLGFLLYRVRFEVLEKDKQSSIIRSTIEYEIAEEYAANASLVSIDALATMAQVIGKHLTEEHKAPKV